MLNIFVGFVLNVASKVIEKKLFKTDKLTGKSGINNNVTKTNVQKGIEHLDGLITCSSNITKQTDNKFDDKMIKPFVKFRDKLKSFLAFYEKT